MRAMVANAMALSHVVPDLGMLTRTMLPVAMLVAARGDVLV
jgi:hypothetical protein